MNILAQMKLHNFMLIWAHHMAKTAAKCKGVSSSWVSLSGFDSFVLFKRVSSSNIKSCKTKKKRSRVSIWNTKGENASGCAFCLSLYCKTWLRLVGTFHARVLVVDLSYPPILPPVLCFSPSR